MQPYGCMSRGKSDWDMHARGSMVRCAVWSGWDGSGRPTSATCTSIDPRSRRKKLTRRGASLLLLDVDRAVAGLQRQAHQRLGADHAGKAALPLLLLAGQVELAADFAVGGDRVDLEAAVRGQLHVDAAVGGGQRVFA